MANALAVAEVNMDELDDLMTLVDNFEEEENMPTHAHKHRSTNDRKQLGHRLYDSMAPKVVSLRKIISSDARGYMQLDLSGRDIHDVPAEVYSLVRVESLQLNNNRIEQLSSAIGHLRRLKLLHLQNNQLLMVPDTVVNCQALRELDISNNRLSTLPAHLNGLVRLETLRMAYNHFEIMPPPVMLLDNLQTLDAAGNSLWHLPNTHTLYHLKFLNLASNQFDHMPGCITECKSLERLNMRGNQLKSLPREIDKLPYLMEINLADNDFDQAPNALYGVRGLQYLNLARNRLKNLPQKLSRIPRLKTLHVQGNQIVSLPNDFENLQFLNVSNNSLRNFSVTKMRSLRSLNANDNKLDNMPMGVYTLPRIEVLRLNNNMLRHISHDIVMLRRLRVLDLGNNEFTTLPQVIDELDNLEYFNIKGNNILNRLNLFQKHKDRVADDALLINPKKDRKKKFGHKLRRREDDSPQRDRSYNTLPLSIQKYLSEPETKDDRYERERHHKSAPTSPRNRHHHHPTRNKKIQVNPPSSQGSESPLDLHDASQHSAGGHRDESTGTGEDRGDSHSTVSETETDFRLLGLANDVQTMLNKQMHKPHKAIAYRKRYDNEIRVSPRDTNNNPGGAMVDKSNAAVRTRTDQFLVTGAGGMFRSSYDPNIKIYFPVNATTVPLDISLQIERVDHEALRDLKKINPEIENIINIGEIVRVRQVPQADFNKQITLTIPAPSTRRGKLHIINYNDDGTCSPSTTGYMMRDGYIYLQAWGFSGRGAVVTHARCKYKACKSVETLLKYLYI